MKVVIGEDHQVFAEALAEALRTRGIDVAGLAGTLPEILGLVARTGPDAVILDIEMPPDFSDEGIRAAEFVRANHPDVGVLVLSQYGDAAHAERLLAKGAHAVGYLLKQRVGAIAMLIDALNRVVSGEVVLDPLVVDRLLARQRRPDPLEQLSAQERRVLALVAEGRSDRAIARTVQVQVKTVERHLTTIRQKLGLPAMDTADRAEVNVRVLTVLAYLRSAAPTARPRGE